MQPSFPPRTAAVALSAGSQHPVVSTGRRSVVLQVLGSTTGNTASLGAQKSTTEVGRQVYLLMFMKNSVVTANNGHASLLDVLYIEYRISGAVCVQSENNQSKKKE